MKPVTLQKDISVSGSIVVSLVQQAVVLMMGMAMLDGGRIFQVVAYAAVAYWVGFTIIMARRHGRLTRPDKIFIRWGYLTLTLVSAFVTGAVWSMRGFR